MGWHTKFLPWVYLVILLRHPRDLLRVFRVRIALCTVQNRCSIGMKTWKRKIMPFQFCGRARVNGLSGKELEWSDYAECLCRLSACPARRLFGTGLDSFGQLLDSLGLPWTALNCFCDGFVGHLGKSQPYQTIRAFLFLFSLFFFPFFAFSFGFSAFVAFPNLGRIETKPN